MYFSIILQLFNMLWSNTSHLNLTLEHLDFGYVLQRSCISIQHSPFKENISCKRIVNEQSVVSYKVNATLKRELDIKLQVFCSFSMQSKYLSFEKRLHLLDDFYISNTVINLLNASLNRNSALFSIPVVRPIGFLRFFSYFPT